MITINGIVYDDTGRAVSQSSGTPSGIGGVATGRAPWYGWDDPTIPDDQLSPEALAIRKQQAALTPHPYTEMSPELLALTRGIKPQTPLPSQYYDPNQVLTPSKLPDGYDPNKPLDPIGGVQNDPRYGGTPASTTPNWTQPTFNNVGFTPNFSTNNFTPNFSNSNPDLSGLFSGGSGNNISGLLGSFLGAIRPTTPWGKY
jgi:hypothetical protein